MEFRNLKDLDLKNFVECFNHAFSDYVVPVKITEEQWARKCKGARVDYELSFGAFEDGSLVGFILHGIDMLNGLKTAYNMATGVIPEFRGRKIVQKIYDYAIPILQANEIKQATLEVICENQKAVKAYQNVGFQKLRELHCFSGKLQLQDAYDEELKGYNLSKAEEINWDKINRLLLYQPSWENSQKAVEMQQDKYELFELYQNDEIKGYVIIHLKSGYIVQFGVDKNDLEKNGKALFRKIGELTDIVSIYNIDCKEIDVINLLTDVGLKVSIKQFEMIMPIT